MVNKFLVVVCAIPATLAQLTAIPFSPGFDIKKVASVATSIPSHSWEYGTASEALLELYNPDYSVFGGKAFPVPTLQPDRTKSLNYARGKIKLGEGYSALYQGEGSAGDPLSLGVAGVMLGKTDERFKKATEDSVSGIFAQVPKWKNGAISHRASVAELWADFMYMAPPFLAYYAADQQDSDLLRETVHQCELYRQVLRYNGKDQYNGLWMHIIGPQSQDTGLWSTGNAWAAAGMARVLATVINAPVAKSQSWQADAVANLTQWIGEILDGARRTTLQDGLLRNYLNDVNSGHGFGEISGSSLMAATAYRMVVLRPQEFGQEYIDWADGFRLALGKKDKQGRSRVSEQGVAMPTVNPLAWLDTTPFVDGSPEGQSFVVMMYAAWRDCVQARRLRRNAN
ncbi:hypothetical protein P691DRAFT_795013 [Macrolepiota fuliginosa MF-IS2]|uniref:Six-hairpin glycosidase n=1 Tax=Macrolepiota fuliginosa MF-IS2 TaxID=1400762 RepID=A0A9P5XB18_9AGAR|nr:hypothetical protein P691DRAFT_795013 [Macrolepiota fuliginosa MF-IS2]